MSQDTPVEINPVQRIGQKFETLAVVDRLIEENEALKKELTLKTKRLRTLQMAVHAYLMGSDDEGEFKAQLKALSED